MEDFMAKNKQPKYTIEDKNEKRKKKCGILLLILSIVCLLGGSLWIILHNIGTLPTVEPKNKVIETTPQLDFEPHSTESRGIEIPATNGLVLKAGQKRQEVNFYNPESNKCCFKISLYLSNGELIYQSGLIAPDENITQIELKQELQSGVYRNCQLKYQCYSVKDNTELSGADIKLEINVK